MTWIGMKHAQKRLVDVGHAAGFVKREHSRRNALQYGLHLTPAPVKFSDWLAAGQSPQTVLKLIALGTDKPERRMIPQPRMIFDGFR